MFLFILFSLLQGVIAETDLDDTGFYEETGIDSSSLQGCDSGCTYEGGILTMTSGASLTLTDLPDDLIIDTNGGTISLPSGDTIEGGALDTSTMTAVDSTVTLAVPSSLDLEFKDSVVNFGRTASIGGTGIVEDGVIIFIESGTISMTGSDSFAVQNLYEPQFYARSEVDGFNFEKGSRTILQANIEPDTKIGDGTNYITMSGDSDTFVYVNGYLSCTADCNYDAHGSPDIIIHGSGMKTTLIVDDDNNFLYAQTERLSTRTISFNSGDQHVIEGDPYITENSFFFTQQPLSYVPQSVDGVYINTQKTSVQVFFEKPPAAAGNYMIVADGYMKMSGSDYYVAFGDVGGGNPGPYFPYSFTEQNKYVDVDDEQASFRLMAGMNGGEATYYNNNFKVTKPGVVLVNGVNAVEYASGEDKPIQYSYFYVHCDRDPPGEGRHASCGEVGVSMADGGYVNVKTEQGTGYSLVSKKEVLEFTTPPVEVDDDSGLQYPERDHKYTLDTSKVYVLGYKGGSAAEALVGKDLEFKEWGHAGLMYYKDDQWWVAEENGVSATIQPFEQSLFSQQTDGVYEIQVQDPTPIIESAERLAGSDYKHYDPVDLPIPHDDVYNAAVKKLSPGFTCSGFCEFNMEASPEIEEAAPGYGVSFSDFTARGTEVDMWTYAQGLLAAQIETTPRKLLVDNPNLVEIPNEVSGPVEQQVAKLTKIVS